MRKNLIKKVLAKLNRPTLATFYILGGTIYFSTRGEGGLDHKALWKIIVDKIFKDLSPEDRAAMLKSNFGADRGKIDWTGEIIEGEPIGEGDYIIRATPGSKKYETKIKSTFGLTGKKVKTDYEDDSLVYITVRDERDTVNEILKTNKSSPNQDAHVATINMSLQSI